MQIIKLPINNIIVRSNPERTDIITESAIVNITYSTEEVKDNKKVYSIEFVTLNGVRLDNVLSVDFNSQYLTIETL